MPAFLPMILKLLVGMGGWTAASALAKRYLGKQAGTMLGKAGAGLAEPVAGAIGPRAAGWAGKGAQWGAQSLGQMIPGLAGFEAATHGYESLFGEQTPESGAQLEYTNPPIGARQNVVLDQVMQEEQLRGALKELGIDLDDLLSQQSGYGGLV